MSAHTPGPWKVEHTDYAQSVALMIAMARATLEQTRAAHRAAKGGK